MTNEKAIQWLTMQRNKPIRWDDYSDETKFIREAAELELKCAYDMAIEALKAQKPRVIPLKDVVAAEIGTVFWIEFRFDGNTAVDAFMTDIDSTQKPVLCNSRECWICVDEQNLHERIMESFGVRWDVCAYRVWNRRPSEESRMGTAWNSGDTERGLWDEPGYGPAEGAAD